MASKIFDSAPRHFCGVTSEIWHATAKRFVALEPMFATGQDREIRYFIEAYVDDLDQAQQRANIRNGIASWAAEADFTYRAVDSREEANVIISTGRGPRSQFDGKGKVLAWAELDMAAPDQSQVRIMRFDLDEDWTLELHRCVFAHELGHILGLDHSTYKTALMYPYANEQLWTPQPQDDIPRIRGIYGAAKQLPPPKPKPKTPVPLPPNGGSVFDELIRKLVGMAVDALIAMAEKLAAQTATKADDFMVGLVKPKRDWLVDMIAKRLAGLGRIPTATELQAIAAECVTELRLEMAA